MYSGKFYFKKKCIVENLILKTTLILASISFKDETVNM